MIAVLASLRKGYWILALLAGIGIGLFWSGGCEHSRPREESAAAPAIKAPIAGGAGQAAEFRLARDTEVSRQHEILAQLAADGESNAQVRAEAEQAIWRLAKIEAEEHEAEAVLAAGGWQDAAVTILGDDVWVIVYGRKLTASEAARIGSLVAKAAGIDQSGVKIMERP